MKSRALARLLYVWGCTSKHEYNGSLRNQRRFLAARDLSSRTSCSVRHRVLAARALRIPIIPCMTSIAWEVAGEFEDIKYHKADGLAKITIDRPEVRNAFRPLTVVEMQRALEDAREDHEVGVIILTGEGPEAFCSGGDQKVRGDAGYLEAPDDPRRTPGGSSVGRLHVTQLVGPKKAKEMWFLCRMYTAEEALEMGLVNEVVPLAKLETETVRWCREMLERSPFALRLLKASFHAHEDGFAGIQQLAHDANLLFYGSEEAQEGRDAYKEKRKPDFSRFPHRP